MNEKVDPRKDAMRQHITISIITQLQLHNPEVQLDENMLRFKVHSFGQAAHKLLSHPPSIQSNNQVSSWLEFAAASVRLTLKSSREPMSSHAPLLRKAHAHYHVG